MGLYTPFSKNTFTPGWSMLRLWGRLMYFVANLLRSTTSRASSRTVLGYASGDNIADGQSLLTVPANIGAYPGLRLLADNTWSTVDASDAPLTYTGQSVADAATNLWLNSEFPNGLADVTNSSGITVATSTILDFANALQFAGGGTDQYIYQTLSTTGTYNTLSAYIEMDDGSAPIIGASSTDASVDVVALLASSTSGVSALSVDRVYGTNVYHVSFNKNTGFLTDTMQFRQYSGNSGKPFKISGCMFETGSTPSPYIQTTTATASRAADNVTIQTAGLPITAEQGAIELVLTPDETGQAKTIFSSYVDASNSAEVISAAGTVTFRKRVAGVDYDAVFSYAHVKDTKMRVDLKYDKTNGIAIRAADYSDDISLTTWATNANTDDMPLSSTVCVGNVNSTSYFKALYENPKFYQDDSVTGWV